MKFPALRIGLRLSLCLGLILVLMAAVTALAGFSNHRAQFVAGFNAGQASKLLNAQAESLRQTADAMKELSGLVSRNTAQEGDAHQIASLSDVAALAFNSAGEYSRITA